MGVGGNGYSLEIQTFHSVRLIFYSIIPVRLNEVLFPPLNTPYAKRFTL